MEGTSSQKSRILIVDDAESHRFILRNIIMEMGYQPVLAESGAQALKVFSRCNPELVLLDVSMPEMDGFEVCRRLKGNSDTRNVPVIFISAFENSEDIARAFEMGGEDYVTKPFIPEVVKARVSVRLKLAEAMKRLSEMG
ncbi:MAG: response regulator [Lachnospiraceae bacterium]|nr:response regulator [Lachnospiraceae bacterium]